MNHRAIEFLDRWEADHVHPVPPDQRPIEAQRLAKRCLDDANRAGLDQAALEVAAGGDLVANMLQAMAAAAARSIGPPDEEQPF